jgi:hypothetical protein
MRFKMNTDTATLAVFDPSCLTHRLNQNDDWWSVPDQEINEVNSGNICIVGLDEDGIYDVDVKFGDITVQKPSIESLLRGRRRLYIGPGEDIVAGGIGPDQMRNPGGKFIDVTEGTYVIKVSRPSQFELLVVIDSRDTRAANNFKEQLILI